MKLHYAAGTCSLSPHIVASEAGIPLELQRVQLGNDPEYVALNPKGYVPALGLDDGSLLTEGVAIVQYLADRAPESGLAPPAGTAARYELQSWLTFISSELHKMYSPWLFHPEYGEVAQQVAREKIATRLALVERHLAKGAPFLLGTTFTVADAYLFTIVGWSPFAKIDLAPYPHLRNYMNRVSERPKVREAIFAHGMKIASY
ncbi:glutathione transferase GstA [Pendulispora rubella]|uniref:Glutathione transferase GstA n=1 Tax=Pendulispora rubella TaxID=2741070 RepID=A0ABZ2KR07_9BACT